MCVSRPSGHIYFTEIHPSVTACNTYLHVITAELGVNFLGVVYMNPDWVSIPNDTSNSIRVYMGDWVQDWKVTANENLIPDWNSFQIHVPTMLFLRRFSTYKLKYVNKTSHFTNNLYFGHNERRFHFEFHSRVKFRSKFTWFRIDISFRIECSIRNEKWNELDPEVATQSGFR